MPSYTEISIALLLVGTVSAGLHEALKKILVIIVWKGKKPAKDSGDNPWWWTLFNVLFSICVATGIGWFLPFESPWNLLTGTASGLLASSLYRRAKKLVPNIKLSTD